MIGLFTSQNASRQPYGQAFRTPAAPSRTLPGMPGVKIRITFGNPQFAVPFRAGRGLRVRGRLPNRLYLEHHTFSKSE